MKRRLWTIGMVLALLATGLQAAFAQRSATVAGIIESETELPEGTRVAVHVVDRDGVWGTEVASVVPVANTFSLEAAPIPAGELNPFRSGAVLLPGLQNEYRVSPEDVNYAQGRVNMYVDGDGNGVFDRVNDAFFIGVPSLESPVGFFSLIYVDRAATLTGAGQTLELAQGWNVFTVRFPGEQPQYAVAPLVEDVKLDVFLP